MPLFMLTISAGDFDLYTFTCDEGSLLGLRSQITNLCVRRLQFLPMWLTQNLNFTF